MDKKYHIYFEHSNGSRSILGCVENKNNIWNDIVKPFLDKHNFKTYYIRIFINELDEEVWDVGSHTEFFIIKETDNE